MGAKKRYYAHSTKSAERDDWQDLAAHLNAVAELAARFAAYFGAEAAAGQSGLLHDLGKYTTEFLARLNGGKNRTDHSTAGARVVMDLAKGFGPSERRMAEIIAYCVAGHHSGLPDRHDDDSASLARRIDGAKLDKLDPVWRHEIAPDLSRIVNPALKQDPNWRGFELAFLGRMIFSCLIDADRTDTACFEAQSNGIDPEPEPASLNELLDDFVARFDAHMAAKTKADTKVNRLRADILAHVRSQAAQSPGLFTLNVPTGGGKTLASLGFALDHARHHSHRRIIYAIPFTSIIEQTASIFRDVLGSEHILEHHSAIEEGKAFQGKTAQDKLKLAMENWDKPIVVTTNVQLFESLFAARPSRCRKLHNIAGSVIILDEAQTIPRPLLGPCVRALDVLARSYKCTIVLCTATQPALNASLFPPRQDTNGKARPHMLGLPLTGRELAPDPAHLASALQRTRIAHVGDMCNGDLIAALEQEPQGLVIVNSRKHAYELFKEAQDAKLEGLVHLTTRQYAAHRRRLLEDVRQRLANGAPCRVIATSLIEAGVDVDFPRVWRAKAGLDQIAQAAGRCNREGRRARDESVVSVFNAPDYDPPSEIKGLIGDMERMFDKHVDLLAPDAIADYFHEGFWRLGEEGVDRHEVLNKRFLLSGGETDFSYRTVGEKFRMIESGMMPVIVPRDDEAIEWVAKLSVADVPSGAIARRLQSHVVQVPPADRSRLIAAGHVRFVAEDLRADQFAVLTASNLYCETIGLVWEHADYLSAETLNV